MARAKKPPYLDASLDVDKRVSDLISRMTLHEKIRQMSMTMIGKFFDDGKFSRKIMLDFFNGMSVGCLQDLRKTPRENAAVTNSVQRYLVEETRLGIPAMVISECLHGHRSEGATIFPQAIALGSTWNTDLIGKMAETAAIEARATGIAQALAPDLDLAREPRWGRCEETYGEDPYLVEKMGVAYITAMQGEGPKIDDKHLACTAKHFAAHGSPEAGINIAPVVGGERDLRSTYLPPFKAAVTEAGCLSVMPAYSEYDGVPAHASKLLLTKILREEWGFRGYTFCDYGAVSMLKRTHRVAHSAEEAGKMALEAGLDLEAPSDFGYGDTLLKLVEKGEVPIELVDQAVSRILRVKFLTGLFENPFVDEDKAERIVGKPAHRRLALDIARESIVLLKNERNLLPLGDKIKKIAVIGPNADAAQLGDYSIPKPDAVTPLQGIRKIAPKGVEVDHAKGCGIFSHSREGFADAVETARESDVAIVFIGGTSVAMAGTGWGEDETASTCGEGFDVTDLNPPGAQSDLVKEIVATGTPTIVVLVNGRPYSIPWMAENVPAIIEAWYPSEEGGTAIAEILFGKVNPSGKLNMSFPRSTGNSPAFYNHKPSARGYYGKPGSPENPGRDYVFEEPTPLFPFGHGLSYTRFSYSNLRVSPNKILPGGRVEVSVDVRNAGKVAGKEVVQLYLNDVISSTTTSVKSLRGFEKIHLEPGEKKTVSFTLTPDDLKLLNINMEWVVEPGEFEVIVGDQSKTFEVVK